MKEGPGLYHTGFPPRPVPMLHTYSSQLKTDLLGLFVISYVRYHCFGENTVVWHWNPYLHDLCPQRYRPSESIDLPRTERLYHGSMSTTLLVLREAGSAGVIQSGSLVIRHG